jgi:hypothetical protein
VQAAIDFDAPQLTTIRVCPGTYVGNVDIPRDLTLIGAGDGTGAGNTTLQGNAADQPNSVVTIDPLGQTVTLRGLRITGGFDDLGGGVCHQGASLTMIDCTITGNTADTDGGGLCSDPGSTAFLNGCTISGNHALGGGSSIGGGIFSGDTMTLTDCLVEANTADFDGGGIYVSNSAPDVLTLIRTVVRSNHADGTGGGIFNDVGSTVDLQSGASVSGNTAGTPPVNCGGPGTYNGTGCAP